MPFMLVLMGLVFMMGQAFAEEPPNHDQRPLWELGVGATALRLPYYPGARDAKNYLLPVIYPIYRGRVLRADADGIRGVLFQSDRVDLRLSADGALARDSDKIAVREGMPNLDPTFQIGPSLKVTLWKSEQDAQSLVLGLPVRAVFALGTGLDSIGFTSSPALSYYRQLPIAFKHPWWLSLSAGVQFGSNAYHDYYYSVARRFATPTRPAYDAGSGFGGTRFTAALSNRVGDLLVTTFARYDRVNGATFDASPLVERDSSLTVGVLFAWFVAHSNRSAGSAF